MAHLVIIIIVKETDHQELCDMTRKEGRENSTDGTTIGEGGVGQDGESQTGESLKTFYATVDIWHQEKVTYLCGRLHC